MKNIVFKTLVALFLTFSVVSCGLFCKQPKENENANMYAVTMYLNEMQLDSLCSVDYIPRDFTEWINMSFLDYETNARIYKYAYIKKLESENELIYIALKKGEIYKVTKRIVDVE